MHDFVDELYDLCETLEKDLAKTNEKLRMSGGELSGSDLEYVDKLTHALKSIKTTVAMIEAEEDEDSGYSGGYWPMSYEGGQGGSNARGGNRGGSNRGGSYNGGSYASYARGRRNAKRDSMGRYSREGGYSREGDFRMMLQEAMTNAPDEQTRMKLQRMMNEM